MSNPFTNAVVVGADTDPRTYERHTVARGNPGYTMSRSDLMRFWNNPHKWIAGEVEKTTSSMEWGSLVDALLLAPPDHVAARFAVTPDTYPATAKKKGDPPVESEWNYRSNYCKNWITEQRAAGKTVVDKYDYFRAADAANKLRSDPVVKDLLATGQRQVLITAEYRDTATGLVVPMKFLLDHVPATDSAYGHGIADLKTTENANPQKYYWHVRDYNYYVQAKMYLDAWNAATNEERDTFYHVVQENLWPYEIGFRLFSSEFLELGCAKYTAALKLYAECVVTKHWPTVEEMEARRGARVYQKHWLEVQPDQRMMEEVI